MNDSKVLWIIMYYYKEKLNGGHTQSLKSSSTTLI